MKIIEEAKKRKVELERELKIIKQLLALYPDEDSGIDADLSLFAAHAQGLITTRTRNCIADHPSFGDRNGNEIRLYEVKALLQSREQEIALLRTPNFGRKSLQELNNILKRI